MPAPARASGDPQQLSDERRYDVPLTVISTEFSSEAQQFTEPEELAQIILETMGS